MPFFVFPNHKNQFEIREENHFYGYVIYCKQLKSRKVNTFAESNPEKLIFRLLISKIFCCKLLNCTTNKYHLKEVLCLNQIISQNSILVLS
jgi:hypothetical protein